VYTAKLAADATLATQPKYIRIGKYKNNKTKNNILMLEINSEFIINDIKYIVVGNIGEGGTSFIFKLSLNTDFYALKLLKDELPSEKIKRFKNEIYFTTNANHRNIVRTLSSGEYSIINKTYFYYLMPFYTKTLRDLITEGIDHVKIPEYLEQLINGLSFAHSKKIYHRDLKPENILYDNVNDNLIIADWGIAHFNKPEQSIPVITKPTTRLANFQYAAPEQREKKNIKVNEKADIYAVGLILNEMFTKEIAIGSNYKKISTINTEYAYYDAIVDWAIRQNPDERPKSIDRLSKKVGVYYFDDYELHILISNIILNIKLSEIGIPNYPDTLKTIKNWIFNSKIPSKKNKKKSLINEVVKFIAFLIYNHPFADGNKRISNIILTSTLDYLDLKLIAKFSEITNKIEELVMQNIGIETFENWLKLKIISKDDLNDIDKLIEMIE